MSQKKQQKVNARKAKEARQARRVVNGICIGLVVLVLLMVGGYYIWSA